MIKKIGLIFLAILLTVGAVIALNNIRFFDKLVRVFKIHQSSNVEKKFSPGGERGERSHKGHSNSERRSRRHHSSGFFEAAFGVVDYLLIFTWITLVVYYLNKWLKYRKKRKLKRLISGDM